MSRKSKGPRANGGLKEGSMTTHRSRSLMRGRAAALLSILQTIVELTTAVVKLWHSL
jgi:hypothetical protein